MRLTAELTSTCATTALQAVLATWDPPGIDVLDRRDTEGGARWRIRVTEPAWLEAEVSVTWREDGLSFAAIEGDLATFDGELSLVPEGAGTRVRWRVDLWPRVALPGPLVRELEEDLLPAWTASLEAAALEGRDEATEVTEVTE